MSDAAPLLVVSDLAKHYPTGGDWLGKPGPSVRALDGISLRIDRGETFGLVGESGCGKSTAGKAILRLVEPTRGSVKLDGVELTTLPRAALRDQRRNMQVIFQDPYASLNPKMTAAAIVTEPFRNYGLHSIRDRQERVAALFAKVGLRPDQMSRYPHEFSGGQRQRLGIARALALEPELRGRRRAGVSPGRLGAGAGDQPAGPAAAGVRTGLPVHRPRPCAWCATSVTASA